MKTAEAGTDATGEDNDLEKIPGISEANIIRKIAVTFTMTQKDITFISS